MSSFKIPKKNKKYPCRKTIRLQTWDYSWNGMYWVTIETKDFRNYFGKVVYRTFKLSEIGKIALKYWKEIPKHFENTWLDFFAIMPNHIHGIIAIDNPEWEIKEFIDDSYVHAMACTYRRNSMPIRKRPDFKKNEFSKPIAGSLSVIVNQFKSSVKRWCNKNGHSYFMWKPRFYEHVIRNEKDLERIRKYIRKNIPELLGEDCSDWMDSEI